MLAADGPVPELLRPYLDLVRAANPPGELRCYPGSPALARAILRPLDRIELVELHGTDHGLLEEWAGGAALVRRIDGLAALVHRLPPPERRGVALIDPSYEIKSDYEAVVAALARAHRRFATGVFLLWYPVIERDADRGADDGADGPPASPASSGSSCPCAPTRPAAA